MAKDTATLVVDGSVGLLVYRDVVANYTALLVALAVEIAKQSKVDWDLEEVSGGQDEEAGEALITARGASQHVEDVERIISAYGAVGTALERREPVPYSPPVQKAALGIRSVLNGRIRAVRFQTADVDATVYSDDVPRPAASPQLKAYGAVRGRIQTLSNRQGLRFTLYDSLYDRAVSCYLSEDQEELVRGAWGQRAIVAGWVSRDALTGRPIAIREVTHVETLPETSPGDYRRAIGAVSVAPDAESPEATVRRFRDA
jgi:hypothetical protein